MQNHILENARSMARAVDEGIGPDIVIIVNSSDEQALFWQKRLTGRDNVHGSGVIIKKDAVVISVSEADWTQDAGNGLGTLNGLVQASRKARDMGLIDFPPGGCVKTCADNLLKYSKGKSIFMFHTAGKGTRVSPLPAAEVNSKSNICLPRMIEVYTSSGSMWKPMTVLESALRASSIYAPTREDRLSVFWADQIIINENDISFSGKHHVEIFGQTVPLTEDIRSYGVLIGGEEADAKQREKLTMEAVKELLLPGSREVYRSIGSFTISFSFLRALINVPEHIEALTQKQGKLDTDPHWWQPLTSTKAEYLLIMGQKGVSGKEASRRWQIISDCRGRFLSSSEFTASGMDRLVGSKDVGAGSLWFDYGQNKYYLKNLQTLTEDSLAGRAARLFFGVEDGRWIIHSDTSEAKIENSIIQNSEIEKGVITNCIVVNSVLKDVRAEDSVIISGNIFKLNAKSALCYNVVGREASAGEGQILADIFHPEVDRAIEMRTDIGRDGALDWNANGGKGEFIYDNLYTYPEINEMMKGVKVGEVADAKKKCVERLSSGENVSLSFADRIKELAGKRNMTEGEARNLIEERMRAFGEI